jgi:hypothetical protein
MVTFHLSKTLKRGVSKSSQQRYRSAKGRKAAVNRYAAKGKKPSVKKSSTRKPKSPKKVKRKAKSPKKVKRHTPTKGKPKTAKSTSSEEVTTKSPRLKQKSNITSQGKELPSHVASNYTPLLGPFGMLFMFHF